MAPLLRPAAALGVGFAAVILAVSCRTGETPSAADTELTWCIPADTLALAGVNVAAVNALPVSRSLPLGDKIVGGSIGEASYALLAFNGKELLVAVRQKFGEPPPGVKLLARDIAVAASPELTRAASAQFASRRTGAAWLLDHASSVTKSPIWAVSVGGVTLPLSGNAANLNRLLQAADYFTVSVSFTDGIHIELAGAGKDEASSRKIEETLRAFLSLAASAAARQPELAGPLRAAAVRREGIVVHAAVNGAAEQSSRLLNLFLH